MRGSCRGMSHALSLCLIAFAELLVFEGVSFFSTYARRSNNHHQPEVFKQHLCVIDTKTTALFFRHVFCALCFRSQINFMSSFFFFLLCLSVVSLNL